MRRGSRGAFQKSIARALAQNAARPTDEVVPDLAVRSVFSMLETPSEEEGFDEVIVVSKGA
jgi:hypothetical protein